MMPELQEPRGLRLLLILGGILALVSCTSFRSVSLSPAVEEDHFPEIQRHATERLVAQEAGFEIRVLYGPGDGAIARQVAEDARKVPRFLERATGRTAEGTAVFYLFPLAAGIPAPTYSARGRASFVGVLFHRPGRNLLELEENVPTLYESYPHELAHAFLHGLEIEDRWLGDGLPEYLVRRYLQGERPELARSRHPGRPPLLALRRTPLESWTLADFRRIEQTMERDPALAEYLGEQMLWRYAAAEELVARWLAAAERRGIEDPVVDLVARMERVEGRVRFEDVRRLSVSQTGGSLEEHARVGRGEVAAARQRAWEKRKAEDPRVRTHALSTLAFAGPPPGVDVTELFQPFDLPTSPIERRAWLWLLVERTGRAVAAGGDALAAIDYTEAAEAEWTLPGAAPVPPEIWELAAEVQPDLALRRLVRILDDPRRSLDERRRANLALERLTGLQVGWKVSSAPSERRAAADRWARRLNVNDRSPEAASGGSG